VIRRATLADVPQVVAFGKLFHAQSQQPFPYEESAGEQFASGLIENSSSAVFLSETGMIGGVLVPAYCAPDWVMAVELFWWAEGGGIGLLKAFETWASEMEADEVRMTSLASLERADKLLRRLSYTPAEISYRKLI